MTSRVEFAGCSFTYKVQGQGEPVVLIQGVGLHGDGWLPQTDQLSSQFQCLTFDNRGMGKSQPVGAAISVEQMATDTVEVMNSVGFNVAHLVGPSLGGAIAQQIALTHPKRVKSLSLLCASARGADATRLSWKLIWCGMRSRVGSRRMRRRAFLEIIMSSRYLATQDRDALAARLAPIFGHDLADTPPVAMSQLQALKRFDVTHRLAELAGIPTLVISAAEDMIFPPQYGNRLAAGIPGAQFLKLANSAHGVTIQRPDAVNTALVQHLTAAGSCKL